jgi:hypothetical protein
MQWSLARRSTWRAPVWQKLEQSAANFPPSICAKDVLTNDGHASCPKLVAEAFFHGPCGLDQSFASIAQNGLSFADGETVA